MRHRMGNSIYDRWEKDRQKRGPEKRKNERWNPRDRAGRKGNRCETENHAPIVGSRSRADVGQLHRREPDSDGYGQDTDYGC